MSGEKGKHMPWRVLRSLSGVMLRRLKISAVCIAAPAIVIAIPGVIYAVLGPSSPSSVAVPLPYYLGMVAVELLVALTIWFAVEHELGRRQKIRRGREFLAFRFPLLLSARKARTLDNTVTFEYLDGKFYLDDESMTLRCEYRGTLPALGDVKAVKALEAEVVGVVRRYRPKSAWPMRTHSFLR